MIKNLGFVILAGLLLIGCGSGKRTVKHRKEAPMVENGERGGSLPLPKGEGPAGLTSTVLPEDTGRFEKFPISSTEEYISTFASMAQHEMRVYGIPASITLAQGILESGSGRGELTLKTNNHFGIKCHTGWQGDFDFHDDDAQGECFRKYNHPMFSFRDHSLFLTTRSRYAFLFDYRVDDYKKWAHGLRQAGYATDRKYPEKLISLIERYGLDRYDGAVLAEGGWVSREPAGESPQVRGRIHTVQQGDTLYAISRKYGITVEELRQLNNLNGNIISIGQRLQLDPSK